MQDAHKYVKTVIMKFIVLLFWFSRSIEGE